MNETTLKQMGRDCMALISKKIKHDLTAEEYYIGIMELHKKYPMNGDDNFYNAAQKYIRHYQKKAELPEWLVIKPKKSKPKEGI